MQVIYKGRDKVLLTDYNGNRYAFARNVPKEIPDLVYRQIVSSGHVTSQDLVHFEPKLWEHSHDAEPIEVKLEPKAKVNPKKGKKK